MNPRFRANEEIRNRHLQQPAIKLSKDVFGKHVFDKGAMRRYLSDDIFQALMKSIEEREMLDPNLADPVAAGIKAWSMDHGVTHFTHWFQPLTGRTAEKHEALLDFIEGEAIARFSGEELRQQEPDASSFPSGGLRTTFEARGYTAWDCSSPVFILETTYGTTLCIPTIFVSYTGQALDYKIPLLRTVNLIRKAATELAQLFDPSIKQVHPTLGIEQEYFLVDRSYYLLRPDLVLSGRTLLGASSSKGRQRNNHYFGAIPERIYAFMNELEYEAHRLGIPMRTRHNEVAPGQFECAPKYQSLNVAVDHGLMIMDLIDRIAQKHDFVALLHEKPFHGVNGSGKHNNWSLMTDTGKNLLAPGIHPEENLMFLAFFVCVIHGVWKYQKLLQASIASAGNDLRLGQHEAPPNWVSVFIGKQLDKVLNDIENPPRRKKNEKVDDLMHLGIASIPQLLLDNTDRNRTSPFAFTGNKFEFRAVGASANSSSPMMVLNLIVAAQLIDFRARVQSKMNRGRPQSAAILDMVQEYVVESKPIRFEGDGYSEAWKKEAKKRGLSIPKHGPDAMNGFIDPAHIELFERYSILTSAELKARYEVWGGQYLSQMDIETSILKEMVLTQIVPAIQVYQAELLLILKHRKAIEMPLDGMEKSTLDFIDQELRVLNQHLGQLDKEERNLEHLSTLKKKSYHYAEVIRPLLQKIRSQVDSLEGMIPDSQWPLPKYREMLFVR
ncbi:MAG: glutamine synthetase III [Bacteroidota bacterium]